MCVSAVCVCVFVCVCVCVCVCVTTDFLELSRDRVVMRIRNLVSINIICVKRHVVEAVKP